MHHYILFSDSLANKNGLCMREDPLDPLVGTIKVRMSTMRRKFTIHYQDQWEEIKHTLSMSQLLNF